jgi:hypothetical protein
MALSLIAHTTQAGNTANNNPVTTATGINTGGASLLVVWLGNYGATSSCTVTDNYSNTWHFVANYSSVGPSGGFFYAWNKSGSALATGTGHTVTVSGSPYASAIIFAAFGGTQTSSDPLVNYNGSFSNIISATNIQPGSISTTSGNLIVTGWTDNNDNPGASPVTGGITYSEVDQLSYSNGTCEGASLYWGTAAGGSENPTWAGPGYYTVVAVAQFASGGGGGPTTGFMSLPLLGVQ